MRPPVAGDCGSATEANAQRQRRIPCAIDVRSSNRFKSHLHLHPHAADAVSPIAIQEASRGRTVHTHLWHVDVLRMIESVKCFPAELQPAALAKRDRLG